MELEALKASWNKLDERLAATENTPIQATSFAIVEGVMVIGLIPLVWKLSLLSKFDLGGKSSG